MSNINSSDSHLKRKVKEELSDSENDETTIAVPTAAKRSKDCPYLDSINRKVLDFGKYRNNHSSLVHD